MVFFFFFFFLAAAAEARVSRLFYSRHASQARWGGFSIPLTIYNMLDY